MTIPALSCEALRAAIDRLPDDGLAVARMAALDALQNQDLPSIRDEDWKYTDLSHAIEVGNRWLAGDPDLRSAPAPALDRLTAALDAHWFVIENGSIDALRIGVHDTAQLQVSRLSDKGLGSAASTPLENLNTALLIDGLHIRVTGEIDRPLALLFADSATGSPAMVQGRVVVSCEPGSSATVCEFHHSHGSADHYANVVVDLSLEDGARVDYLRLQERNSGHDLTSRLAIAVGRDATFRHAAFELGGHLVRNDIDLSIAGAGSHSNIGGLYLVGDRQHVDNHARIDHRVGPAVSRQDWRGILAGRARGVWNGKAIVHTGADGTDAEQSNHNLLLSRQAEINAKPELEIYADDVKCSHGATVGQLDDTALYYLRTRGLDRHHARKVLTRAFAQTIVDHAPVAELRDFVADRIVTRLEQLLRGVET